MLLLHLSIWLDHVRGRPWGLLNLLQSRADDSLGRAPVLRPKPPLCTAKRTILPVVFLVDLILEGRKFVVGPRAWRDSVLHYLLLIDQCDIRVRLGIYQGLRQLVTVMAISSPLHGRGLIFSNIVVLLGGEGRVRVGDGVGSRAQIWTHLKCLGFVFQEALDF